MTNKLESGEQQIANKSQIRPTLKRHLILLLFVINTGNKSFQWIQIPAVTTKAALFYGVDNYVINIISSIFTWSFFVLSWPACFIMSYLGLRKAVLMASFGTALGAILKCFSCYQGGVWLLIIAQVLVSMSEQLIFSAPSRLASVWYPDHQVSKAVAMCVLGVQAGIALGFVLPHLLLNQAETVEEIGQGIYSLYMITMIISLIAFILDYFLFDEEPEFPPGLARFKQRAIEQEASTGPTIGQQLVALFRQIWQLCKNPHLMLLVASFGMRFGTFDAISTLLDQIVSPVWPNNNLLIGTSGFMITIGGAIGVPVWGHFLDKFHRYKLANVVSAILAIISYSAFVYALLYTSSQLLIIVISLVFGLLQIGFQIAGYEMAVELTYPAPELITASLMNVSGPVFFNAIVFFGSHIADNYDTIYVNGFLLICIVVALILILCAKETLKRQAAVEQGRQDEELMETKIKQ